MENQPTLDQVTDRLIDRLLEDPALEEKILRKVAGRFCSEQGHLFKELILRPLNGHRRELLEEAKAAMESASAEYLAPLLDDMHERISKQVNESDTCSPKHVEDTIEKILGKVTDETLKSILSGVVRDALVHKMKKADGVINVTVNLTADDLGKVKYRDAWDY